MPRLWASAASLRNQRSSPPRTSMHQSLKLLRNPWGTAGIPNRRSKAVYTMSDRGFRFPAGNTRPLSCPSNSRAWDRISRPRPVSGTPVLPSGLHPRRRDLPGGGLQLHLLPHGQTDLTGPGSGRDQELEGEPGHRVGGGLPDLSQRIRHVAIGEGRVVALEPGDSGQDPEDSLLCHLVARIRPYSRGFLQPPPPTCWPPKRLSGPVTASLEQQQRQTLFQPFDPAPAPGSPLCSGRTALIAQPCNS